MTPKAFTVGTLAIFHGPRKLAYYSLQGVMQEMKIQVVA